MFDLTSSKILILAIVALIVVGPKDLPILFRSVGKYLAIVRRQARQLRAQFDEALREAELQDLKREFEGVGREMRSPLEESGAAIDERLIMARRDMKDQPREHQAAVEASTVGAAGPRESSVGHAAHVRLVRVSVICSSHQHDCGIEAQYFHHGSYGREGANGQRPNQHGDT